MSIAKKVIDEKTVSLELMKAVTKDGKPFYAYIVIRHTELNQLKEKKGLMVLPKNSIVIYSDYGEEVPAEVEEFAMAEFQKMLKSDS
jgi:uncharacterized protein YjbK